MQKSLKKEFILSKSKGFTLIELLVTATIITIMAVIAIPTYSKYEKENNFQSTAAQMESEIEKVYVLAQNPEQNQDSYYIEVNSDSIDLFNSNNKIESINAPENTILTASSDGKKYLVCNTEIKDYCCVDSSTACENEPDDDVAFFTMTDNDVKKSATYTIKKDPFRVDVEIINN